MAQKPCKNQSKKPSKDPTILSHSRSISTIPAHKNNISFMPKFLLKLLRKKKQSHSHIPSISIDNKYNHNDLCIGKTDHKDNISKIDKHIHGNNTNYLLQYIPIPKRVSSIMSHKSRDHNSNEPKIAKITKPRCSSPSVSSYSMKGKSGRSEVHCTSSDSDKFCDSGVENRGRISRVKSGKIKAIVEKKGGLKIKGFMKMKRREKEEKRFELCKKKILMGERCRPLDGRLRYDKNGILVPEDLPG